MQELTLFVLKGCPYCAKAKRYMAELCREEPRFAALPVREVDEQEEAALAGSYDYYYVPCFFLGRRKLLEGDCTKQQIEEVFRTACGG